jgi:hypothetical protein
MRSSSAIQRTLAIAALSSASLAFAQTISVPDDCDGNGVPDVQLTGPSSAIWNGNYTGSGTAGLFNFGTTTTSNWRNSQNVVVGRPGTRTAAQVILPSTLSSAGGTIAFSCSNAVATLLVSDAFSRNSSLSFDLNGRTLVVASESLALQKTGSGSLLGIFEGGGITSAKGVQFLSLAGNTSWWLRSCDLVAPSISYANLRMSGGLLQTSSIGGTSLELEGTTVDLPTGYVWAIGGQLTVRDASAFVYSGPSGVLQASAGSDLDIQAKLSVEGRITLNGSASIVGNSTTSTEVGMLTATNIEVAPSSSAETLTIVADLSGAAGNRSLPVLDAGAAMTVRGRILIEPSNGSESAPQFGWSMQIARGSSLDLPTPATLALTSPLPNGYYLVPVLQGSGKILTARIERGRFPTPAPLGNRDLTALLRRSAPLNGGVRSRIAGITSNPTTASQLLVLMRSASGTNGFDVQTTTNISANARDVACGDLDGDGTDEIVVAYGSYSSGAAVIPGRVIAYKVSSTGVITTYWTHTLQSSQSANCVCVIPPNGANFAPRNSLMPVGGSVGVGTGSGSGGSVKTLTGTTGTSTGETALTESVSRIRGTDIDNDEDTDVTSSGTSTSLATTTGVVRILRTDSNGRLVAESPVTVPGVVGDFAIDDLDGDGFVDLVAALSPAARTDPVGTTPPLALLQGTPSGFAAPRRIEIGEALAEGQDVELVDADEDGDLDIALAWNVLNNATLGATTLIPVQAGTAGIVTGQVISAVSRPSYALSVTSDGLVSLAPPVSSGASAVVLSGLTGSNAPGDLDGDGFISTADIAILLLDFGACSSSNCPADLDGTGFVDNADIALLLLMFD